MFFPLHVPVGNTGTLASRPDTATTDARPPTITRERFGHTIYPTRSEIRLDPLPPEIGAYVAAFMFYVCFEKQETEEKKQEQKATWPLRAISAAFAHAASTHPLVACHALETAVARSTRNTYEFTCASSKEVGRILHDIQKLPAVNLRLLPQVKRDRILEIALMSHFSDINLLKWLIGDVGADLELKSFGMMDGYRSVRAASVGTIEALRLTHAHFGTDLIRRVASAIERCASSGKTATLQFMIEHLGFDAKHVNPHTRRNLLHDALEGGNEEGARYLIALDIPMHWQDTNGSTPLHLAGHGASADCIRLYAGKQTDNNKVDEWQQTALHRAAIVCRRNHLEVVRALLDVGLDLDAVDAEGDTALHCAAHYANLDMVLALLQCGANPCVLNARGMTAERLANLAHTQTYMNPDAASRPEETQRLIECYRTIELRLKRVTNEGR